MDTRLGEIATGQLPAETGHDHHRPPAVQPFPVTHVVQWRSAMVTQGHGFILLVLISECRFENGSPRTGLRTDLLAAAFRLLCNFQGAVRSHNPFHRYHRSAHPNS